MDDPVLTVIGTEWQRTAAFDIVLLWWLVLGLPLAWPKGVATRGPHQWIGAIFEVLYHSRAAELQAQLMQGSSFAASVRPPTGLSGRVGRGACSVCLRRRRGASEGSGTNGRQGRAPGIHRSGVQAVCHLALCRIRGLKDR